MNGSLPLGAFELLQPFSKGGMGEVWRAIHTATGLPVCVKVVHPQHANTREARTSFASEVRAIASLHHPNVATVLDQGVIPAATADRSEGRLLAGSPYVAMELLDGTVGRWAGRMSWADLQHLLLEVLAGLAYAHAAGIIHRDLKPSNLLTSGRLGDNPVIKLADFGIVHWMEGPTDPNAAIVGTPEYLAPEQREGRERDFGPATDLYALGITALRLAWGSAQAPSPSDYFPPGFDEWIARMVHQDPKSRFPTAAHAAHALRSFRFPDTKMRVHLVRTDRATVAPTLPWIPTQSPRLPTEDRITRFRTFSLAPRPSRWPSARPMPVVDPPLGEVPIGEFRPAPTLSHAGLGLYGLRRTRLVGCTRAKQTLWESLGHVIRDGNLRFVAVQGPAGVGKTRLVDWVARAAMERGVALALRGAHTPDAGHGDGLGPMLERFFRLDGGSEVERRQWLADALPHLERGDLDPLVQLTSPKIQFEGAATERYARAVRALRALHPARPLVFVLEDVHWGSDLIGFAHYLAMTDALPALVVLTVQDETLAVAPTIEHEFRVLQEVAGSRWTHLDVAPLNEAEQRELIRDLLGLEASLAAEVGERAAGNPRYAIQLVSDWVQQGVLVHGAQGYRLRPGVEPEFPRSLRDAWAHRAASLAMRWTADVRAAVALAAILGQEVTWEEWEVACREYGVSVADDAIEDLLNLRLARRSHAQRGFSFSHAMIRETLSEIVNQDDYLVMCAAAARAVEATKGGPDRLGRLWMEAKQPTKALPAVKQAHRTALLRTDNLRAHHLHERWASILAALGIGEQSVEHVEWLQAAGRNRTGPDPLASERANLRALELCEVVDVPSALHCSIQLAVASQWLNVHERPDRALEIVDRLLTVPDLHHRTRVISEDLRARCLWREARWTEARVASDRAFASALGQNMVFTALFVIGTLTDPCPYLVPVHDLERLLARATPDASEGGIVRSVYHDIRGTLAYLRHDHEAAVAESFAARSLAERGGALEAVADLDQQLANIALLGLGDLEEARRRATTAGTVLRGLNRQGRIPWAWITRLAVAAGLEDWSEWALARRELDLFSSVRKSRDAGLTLDYAGDRAFEAGRPDDARYAWSQAIPHFEAVGGAEPAAAVKKKLQRLDR